MDGEFEKMSYCVRVIELMVAGSESEIGGEGSECVAHHTDLTLVMILCLVPYDWVVEQIERSGNDFTFQGYSLTGSDHE